ncbi:MAG TPA: ATP-binding protein [Gemmatimonadales bacterium]
MTGSPTDRRAYAVALRAAAFFVAIGVLTWELAGPRPGIPVAYPLVGVRVLQALSAAALGFLAGSGRSVTFLRWLAWALGITLAVPNLVMMVVWPLAAWEALFYTNALLLGSALVAPWSWKWQVVFVTAVWVATVVTVLLAVPPAAIAPWTGLRVGVGLGLVAALSVVAADLLHGERQRVVQSRARYHSLFEGAGDAIVLLDGAGRIVEANLRFERLLGCPMADIHGRSLGESLAIASRTEEQSLDLALYLTSLPPSGEIVQGALSRADGAVREVEVAFARITGPPPPAVQAIVRDVTDRRGLDRREARVRRMEAMSRFAGGIAHQFNNLLAGVLSQATLLKEETQDQKLISRLEEIAGAARQGERLTKALVRFTPYTTMTARAVSVQGLVASVARTVGETDGPPLVVDVEPDLPLIAADPDHLTHALLELIANAREAMGYREGPVRLTATVERVAEGDERWHGTKPGRYVRFGVIDTGRGMDPVVRAQLFEPFFTTKEMEEGVGVGLASVDWVVRSHKGAIAVESELQRGTTVHLLVPLADEAGVLAPAPVAAAAQDPARITVLVVDDEPLVRKTAVRALERFGYRTLSAENGDAGVAALERATPPVDLAILDVVMPGGGTMLVERMRDIRPDLRVLVSSGFGPSGEVERMLAAGAAGFLQKPYEITELRDAVARALDAT